MRYEIPKAWNFKSEEEVKEYAESVLKAVELDSRYTFFFIEKGKPIEKKIGVALKCVQHFIGNGRIQHIVDTILHEVAHAVVYTNSRKGMEDGLPETGDGESDC